MDKEQSRKKLEELYSRLERKPAGFVEYHLQRMESEFGGWNNQKAIEYFNTLAGEHDHNELRLVIPES